jgi:two-component system, cell cycle sensor histidine kinase and response regulator CckA
MSRLESLLASDSEVAEQLHEIASRVTRLEKLSRNLEKQIRHVPPEMPISKRETVEQVDTPTMIPHPPRRIAHDDQLTDRFPIPTLTTTGQYEGELLTDIFAAVPFPIVALDTTGYPVYWSPAARELFGWDIEEILAAPSQFVSEHRRLEFQRMFMKAKAGVAVREVATTRRHQDGREIPVLVSMNADAGGGVVCVYQPIPGEVPMAVVVSEEQSQRSEQSRKYETIGRMMTGVVHDMNNIHAVIDGNADMLVEWLPEHTVSRGYAEVIRAAVRHASSLTEQILRYASPSTTHLASELNLAEVLRDLTALVRSVVGSSIQVVITPSEATPPLWLDRSQVEQVILNLVTNARDALPEGGAVGIRSSAVTIRPGRKGWPTNLSPGRYVCLTIADNGKGMDDPTLMRMFDPFFSTKESGGTGLGLALVKEIVQKAQGHIEVDSQPDLGTVFRVYFPSVHQVDDDVTDPQVVLPILHSGETALLVDDDDSLRELAKHALESIGYNVIEARTGSEAAKLATLVEDPIDLLVADVVMPGLGGRRLAERLRCTRPGLPVVFVSGYPQSILDYEANTRFVSKPYLPQHLLTAVQKVTSQVAAC